MKLIYKTGDKKIYVKRVSEADVAAFHGEVLHPVYSTFALARDFEWSSRLFFLEMRDVDEEGVGTFLSVEHKSPAGLGMEVTITATVESIQRNELICNIEAVCGERVIATGKTGQKMLKKEKLSTLFNHLYK